MFQEKLDQVPDNRVVFHWYLLCLNGGFINAAGFLATGRYVSHVTGLVTLFGVEIANNRLEIAYSVLSVPLFFLCGAFIAGLFIESRRRRGKKPHFGRVMRLCAGCIFIAAFSAELFGVPGSNDIGGVGTYVLMALLCLASGLQNGAISSSSQRSVRTTHMTGTTTDLGLGLARIYDSGEAVPPEERRANFLRLGSLLFFMVGAIIGAMLYMRFSYHSLLMSGLISTYAAWQGTKQAK